MTRYLNKDCISVDLKGSTKDEILEELLSLLCRSGNIEDREMVLNALKEREATMSSGLEKGIAIPHAKTNGVKETCVAIGLKKEGIDFNSLDGQPAKIFIMLASPIENSGPQMRAMAAFSGALMRDEVRAALMNAENAESVIEILEERKSIITKYRK